MADRKMANTQIADSQIADNEIATDEKKIKSSFAYLHAHSRYSFLSGTIHVERLPVLAKEAGMPAIALTDTNNVTGILKFYQAAKSHKIKPILGTELKTKTGRAVLLARSRKGYSEICRTLTNVLEAIPQIKPKITIDDLLNAAEENPTYTDQPKKRTEAVEEETQNETSLLPFLDALSDDVFILTSTPSLIEGLAHRHRHHLYIELIPAERKLWYSLLDLYKEYHVPVIAGNNLYFEKAKVPTNAKEEKEFTILDKEPYNFHRLLRAISTNTTTSTLPKREHADPSQLFLPEEEFKAMFGQLFQPVYKNSFKDVAGNLTCGYQQILVEIEANIRYIIDSCNINLDGDLEKVKFTGFGKSQKEDEENLETIAKAAFQKRFPNPTADYMDRFNKEIDIIKEMEVASYFLVVHDMISYAKRNNYPYMGRGSGANSFIAYLLEISNVDPVKYKLVLERFLNVERIKKSTAPDFDIDFSWKDRYDVINYVINKYGREKAAMLCTVQYFRDRGAVREVGKALGYTDSEIRYVASHLVSTKFTNPDQIKEDLRNLRLDLELEDIRLWLEYVRAIQGFPRNLSVHAGGLLIADTAITDYTAVQSAPVGVPITQQDMHAADTWKLIKLDILATRGLEVFWETMQRIHDRYGKRPPIDDYYVAFADEPTREIIRKGKTKGCFYIESPAMIALLRKLRTDTFENLTAASSVIRPGVAQSGMMDEFIRRHRDPSTQKHVHPRMGELMPDTYGVMVYQEDVLIVVNDLADFSYAKADVLRRIMSGKRGFRFDIQTYEQEFVEGCKKKWDIDEPTAREIWRQIASFSGYSFCKAHSASYAVLSFQEAWLKVHYTAEFLCGVLNNHGGFYSHQEYINEAKLLGITVRLPDLNQSKWEHHVPEKGVIQLGLHSIKDVSERSLRSILDNRGGEPYTSIEDFTRRSEVTPEDGRILISLGLCDSLGEARPATLFQFDMLVKSPLVRKSKSYTLDFPTEKFSYDLSHLSHYTPLYQFQLECKHLRYSVTDHSLRFLKKYREGCCISKDLKANKNKKISIIGYIAAAKPVRTKHGEGMNLMNLADEFGMIDLVIWPKILKQYYGILASAQAIKVTGTVTESFDVYSVVVDTIERLDYHEAEEYLSSTASSQTLSETTSNVRRNYDRFTRSRWGSAE